MFLGDYDTSKLYKKKMTIKLATKNIITQNPIGNTRVDN
jgi:hypothetical protein